jgi:hypothetical protein
MAKEDYVKLSKKKVEIHNMVVNLALNLSARILEEETEAMFQGKHDEVSEERVELCNQHTRALSGALALLSSVSAHFLSDEEKDETAKSAVTAALLAFTVGADEYMDRTINDESSVTFKDLVDKCMKKINPDMCDKLKELDSIRYKLNEARKVADELGDEIKDKKNEQKTKKESKPKKDSEPKQKKTTTKTKKTSKKEE